MSNIIKSNSEFISNITDSLESISKRTREQRHTKTDTKQIKTRQGKAGKKFKYVDWGTVADWLDRHYPGWSFTSVPESFREYAGYVQGYCQLKIYEKEGLSREIGSWGSKEIILSDNKPIRSDYYKAVESDALKRCAARLGAFNDIYANLDEFYISDEFELKDIDWLIKPGLGNLYKHFVEKKKDKKGFVLHLSKFLNGIESKEDLEKEIKN
ncbi:MAG: hypothetical protein A2X61_15345 [Ignavibacteria bacterium GWB2_35_12]|nr:MAG: hypothetical protein A2X63_03250 [Ignavibacteria bacterium GWA2_35_8]OGU38789.1 MAG: hypothetical protein A2X61_15345 [Ignavibacteria bacterium GWB2_35_12]OGV20301.1 MAG: hypothetical protein A2475_12460 [Ignavibacteria bacterium RIFOXYC2_FULL_35_21]